MINRDINSSVIKSVAYEVDKLYVLFQSGELWEYDKFNKELFFDMIKCDSVGRFFNMNVRNKFKGVCLDEG